MANRISFCSEDLNHWADGLNDVSRALSDARSILNGVDTSEEWWNKVHVNRNLRMNDVSRNHSLQNGRQSVSELKTILGQYETRVENLSDAVKKAVRIFENAEAEVGGGMLNTGRGIAAGAVPAAPTRTSFDWGEAFFTALTKAGTFGKMLSFFDYFTDIFTEADVIGRLGGLGKALVRGYEVVTKWKNPFTNKDFWGLDSYLTSRGLEAASTFGGNFKNMFFDRMTHKTTWILKAIDSGVDNFREWRTGAISGDRAIVEWGAETAGNVAMTAGSIALTGAALTAAGVTAPVWVVTAGGALLVMGADYVYQQITGSDVGIVETAGHWVGEAYDWGKEKVMDAVDTVGDFFGGIKDKLSGSTGSRVGSGRSFSALWA